MKAIFITKIASDLNRNGETVTVGEQMRDQYLVEFKDGTTVWAYGSELSFITENNNKSCENC